MTSREKKAVGLAVVAVLLFVFIQFLLLPLMTDAGRLRKSIAIQERQLAEMQLWQDEQHGQHRGAPDGQGSLLARVEQRSRDFSLFSYLEQSAATSQVKDHVETMQPVRLEQEEGTSLRSSAVELRLHSLSLSQLAHFLHQVESPENLVAVTRLSIQGGEQVGGLLAVSLRVQTVEEASRAGQ